MHSTIYTAGLIVIISSIISIITIEGLSGSIIGLFENPISLLIKLVIKLLLGDDYEYFMNRIYWSLCIIFAIITNIIFKIANWNGGLKTTFASLLIILIFFIIDKIIAVIKEDSSNEINDSLDCIDAVANTPFAPIFKAICTTALIIISVFILKFAVIGTNYLKNIIYNKESSSKYEYVDVNENNKQTNDINDNQEPYLLDETDSEIKLNENEENTNDNVPSTKLIENNSQQNISEQKPKTDTTQDYWSKRQIENIELSKKSIKEAIKNAEAKRDSYPINDATKPVRNEQEALINVYKQQLEEYEKQLKELKK